jgi:hypothetical protein
MAWDGKPAGEDSMVSLFAFQIEEKPQIWAFRHSGNL